MGIKESNWLIGKLTKGTAANPYTQEELAQMARESAVVRDKNDPVSQYVAGRLKMVRRHYYHLKEMFGWVPPTNKEFGEKLGRAKAALDVAYASKYFGGNPDVTEKINQVRGPVESVSKYQKTISGSVEDVDTILKIIATSESLSKWANMKVSDPEYSKRSAEAAQNFDNLFGYLAPFVNKLPPPFNAYSMIFSEIGKSGFFSGMRKKLQIHFDQADQISEDSYYK